MPTDFTKIYKGYGNQVVPFMGLDALITKPTAHNYWTIVFSNPISGARFNEFMIEQKYFGYHPAGYGGGPTRDVARVSTDWTYSCAESCD